MDKTLVGATILKQQMEYNFLSNHQLNVNITRNYFVKSHGDILLLTLPIFQSQPSQRIISEPKIEIITSDGQKQALKVYPLDDQAFMFASTLYISSDLKNLVKKIQINLNQSFLTIMVNFKIEVIRRGEETAQETINQMVGNLKRLKLPSNLLENILNNLLVSVRGDFILDFEEHLKDFHLELLNSLKFIGARFESETTKKIVESLYQGNMKLDKNQIIMEILTNTSKSLSTNFIEVINNNISKMKPVFFERVKTLKKRMPKIVAEQIKNSIREKGLPAPPELVLKPAITPAAKVLSLKLEKIVLEESETIIRELQEELESSFEALSETILSQKTIKLMIEHIEAIETEIYSIEVENIKKNSQFTLLISSERIINHQHEKKEISLVESVNLRIEKCKKLEIFLKSNGNVVISKFGFECYPIIGNTKYTLPIESESKISLIISHLDPIIERVIINTSILEKEDIKDLLLSRTNELLKGQKELKTELVDLRTKLGEKLKDLPIPIPLGEGDQPLWKKVLKKKIILGFFCVHNNHIAERIETSQTRTWVKLTFAAIKAGYNIGAFITDFSTSLEDISSEVKEIALILEEELVNSGEISKDFSNENLLLSSNEEEKLKAELKKHNVLEKISYCSTCWGWTCKDHQYTCSNK